MKEREPDFAQAAEEYQRAWGSLTPSSELGELGDDEVNKRLGRVDELGRQYGFPTPRGFGGSEYLEEARKRTKKT